MTPVLLIVAKVAIVAVLAAAAVGLGGKLVQAVFQRVDSSQAVAGPSGSGARAVAPQGLVAAGEKLRGGVWIGLLERLAVYATVVAHYPDGIAVVLVVKALARYPELKAPNTRAAERFIIGTLVSVLLACAAAGLADWLTGLF